MVEAEAAVQKVQGYVQGCEAALNKVDDLVSTAAAHVDSVEEDVHQIEPIYKFSKSGELERSSVLAAVERVKAAHDSMIQIQARTQEQLVIAKEQLMNANISASKAQKREDHHGKLSKIPLKSIDFVVFRCQGCARGQQLTYSDLANCERRFQHVHKS